MVLLLFRCGGPVDQWGDFSTCVDHHHDALHAQRDDQAARCFCFLVEGFEGEKKSKWVEKLGWRCKEWQQTVTHSVPKWLIIDIVLQYKCALGHWEHCIGLSFRLKNYDLGRGWQKRFHASFNLQVHFSTSTATHQENAFPPMLKNRKPQKKKSILAKASMPHHNNLK